MLIEVVRYNCSHCGEDFRTPDRHVCKYDPDLKNCFTCENNHGWNSEEGDVWCNCSIDALPEDECGYSLQANVVNGNLGCYYHKDCGGKWNENKYHVEIEKKINEEYKKELLEFPF